VLSKVLLDDKALEVQKLQVEGNSGGMVGDGVNDSLKCTITAIEISRATMRNVRRNLVGAFGCNALGIPVAMGVLYPFIGILLLPLIAAAAWPSAR
jgi:P-type Cu+ transporter